MKGYFKSNPFAAMTMHEEDGGSSSASISPHLEEDPVLSFHTSQSSCYIPPTHPNMHGYINEYNYYPSATQNCPTEDPSSMYGSSLDGHPFFSPNTVFSATPSPNDYTGHRCNTMPLYLGYPHMTNGAPSESSGSDFEPEKTKHVTDPVATYHRRHSSADDEEEETEIKRTKKPLCMKRQVREKSKKRCSNCHASNSPSWRRSVSKHSKGDLLCNACGL
ncbi:uncharacterized protein EV154DRAFT_526051 [Mucor mucedo]|uniref:uncharacterized protein n=1 Tax=Mucor mucedo TaxID=29922 RepID=UPI00221E443C|nr:uncharacterized protein EV154DRAFT_526051 [Mucor mucedo]KAI7876291.1 hypothetical protein EV154DRAFT_526051 [Mucor mucedo]